MGEIELSLLAVLVLAVAFLAAGTVKGVIGAGLPTAAVPIAATVVEPALAIALTVVPVLVANVWQTFQGGHYRPVLRRFWPFLLGLALGVLGGAQILVTVEPSAIALVMGALVVLICGYQLLSGSLTVPASRQGWLNPMAGGTCGIFGGVAGMFAPTILYATALRLPKDVLVSLFGMIALFGTLPLYASLAVNRVLAWDELVLSVAAAAPVALGLVAGQVAARPHIAAHVRARVVLDAAADRAEPDPQGVGLSAPGRISRQALIRPPRPFSPRSGSR